MKNIDKIQGDAVLKLFKELWKNSILLKIQLMHGENGHLTRIADVRRRKKADYFLIPYHESFRKDAQEPDDWRLRFEFSGKDNINYAFETREGIVSRNMIWIKFPQIVYRYQRRGHFRLEAPHGTRLYFNIKDTRYNLFVINVSLGGTLGVLVRLTKMMEKELQLETPQSLEHVELIFPTKNNENDSHVKIKKCRIRRHKKNPQTQRYECAIQFTEITENQQTKFSTLFYQWQRDFLRRRKLYKA